MERQTTTTDYEANAQRIAASLGLTVKIAYKGDRCPPWGDGSARGKIGVTHCGGCGSVHGDRYRVTLRLKWTDRHSPTCNDINDRRARVSCVCRDRSLSFDFWGSYRDKQDGKRPGYYDILACVSLEAVRPTDPDEVVEEYGTMKPSQAVAVATHAKRLQGFFTGAELTALSEIQ